MAAGDAYRANLLYESYGEQHANLVGQGRYAEANALWGELFGEFASDDDGNPIPHARRPVYLSDGQQYLPAEAADIDYFGAAIRYEGGAAYVPMSIWLPVTQADYDARHGGAFTRKLGDVLENAPVIMGAAFLAAGAAGALDAFAVTATAPAAPVISLAPAAPSFSPVAAGTGLETVSFIPPGTFELGGQFAGVAAPSAAGGALTASELALFGLTAPTVGPLAVTAGAAAGAGAGAFLGLSSIPLPSGAALGQAVTAGKAALGAATAAGLIGGGAGAPLDLAGAGPGVVPGDYSGPTAGDKVTLGLALAAFAAVLYFSFR